MKQPRPARLKNRSVAATCATAAATLLYVSAADTGWAAQPVEITVSGCVQSESDYLRAGGIGAAKPDAALDGRFVVLGTNGGAFSLTGTREPDLRCRVGPR